MRWATSMVKVLAMMNVPTNSAMPAKTSRPVFMPLIAEAIALAWSSASCWPVVVVADALRDDLVEGGAQGGLAGAGRGLHVDLVVLAYAVEELLRGRGVEEGEAAAGRDVAVVGGEHAGDGGGEDGAVDGQPYGVADLVARAPRGLRVDRDLVLALGRVAAGQRVAGVLGAPVVAALRLKPLPTSLPSLSAIAVKPVTTPVVAPAPGTVEAFSSSACVSFCPCRPVALVVLGLGLDGDVDLVEALGGSSSGRRRRRRW